METIERQVAREARRVTREVTIRRAVAGVLTNEQAAKVLGLSVRQVKRLKSRYRRCGPRATSATGSGRTVWRTRYARRPPSLHAAVGPGPGAALHGAP